MLYFCQMVGDFAFFRENAVLRGGKGGGRKAVRPSITAKFPRQGLGRKRPFRGRAPRRGHHQPRSWTRSAIEAGPTRSWEGRGSGAVDGGQSRQRGVATRARAAVGVSGQDRPAGPQAAPCGLAGGVMAIGTRRRAGMASRAALRGFQSVHGGQLAGRGYRRGFTPAPRSWWLLLRGVPTGVPGRKEGANVARTPVRARTPRSPTMPETAIPRR